MPAPDAMTCDQLARLVGTAKAPTVLDLRPDARRAADPRHLPGARAVAEAEAGPAGLTALATGLSGPVVAVCAEGHGRSQGAAAWLRQAGVAAEYLSGGQAAWAAAGLPLVDPAALTARDAQGRTLWVTRARPKIDRIACPWLIRRFIDPRAVFLYVAPSEVQAVADLLGAMPFDIAGAFWSHRGDLCTFDAILAETGLKLPALDRLALIVRGADTARPDLAPECAGLLAASLGLSRIHADDLAQLEAGMGLYDAFYRWARDATAERHDWTTGAGRAP